MIRYESHTCSVSILALLYSLIPIIKSIHPYAVSAYLLAVDMNFLYIRRIT